MQRSIALTPGIYFIYNRKIDQYIIPVSMNQLPQAHDKVMTGGGPMPIPGIAEIEVSVDSEGLYSFKLVNCDLSIAQSETERCLIWGEGTHLWRVTKNDDGLFAWEPFSEQAPTPSANETGSDNVIASATQCGWGEAGCKKQVGTSDIAEPVWVFLDVNSFQSSGFN